VQLRHHVRIGKTKYVLFSGIFIGIAIAGLFFVWMPLFIYHRWRRRSFRDYMLTKENIDKMREVSREKDL
jgi:hypothetical protein